MGGFQDHVSEHPLKQVQVLVKQGFGRQLHTRRFDLGPCFAQIRDVLIQLGVAGFFTIGAQNKTALVIILVRQIDQAFAQLVALFLRYFLGHANVVVLRQKNQQATSNADLGGQPCALAANRILDDLDQQGLTLKYLLFNRQNSDSLAFRICLSRCCSAEHISHMQKRRPVHADVDERRLHARQYPGHFAQVHVAHQATLQ